MKGKSRSKERLKPIIVPRGATGKPAAHERTVADELAETKLALEKKSAELAEALAVKQRAEGAQAQLAAIVASSHDAIISKDTSGTIISWNEAAERLYGYMEAEAIGQSITMLIPPDRIDEEPAIMARLLRGERIQDMETVRVSKDGRRIDVSVTISPVRDSSGKVIGASKIARDISARVLTEKTLIEREAQFRQLANALPQIVWTARADGFVDYYNDRWYEFTGFPRDRFGDGSWQEILHPDDRQRTNEEYYLSIRSGNLFEIEYRFADRNSGGYRWFLGRAYAVRDDDGNIVRWFGTCTDIDETKRNEHVNRFLADASATLSGLTDYESALRRVAENAVPIFADWCAVDICSPEGALRRIAATPLHSNGDDAAESGGSEASRLTVVPNIQDIIARVLKSGVPEWIADSSAALLRLPHSQRSSHSAPPARSGVKSVLCCPLHSQAGIHGVISFATSDSGRLYTGADLVAAEDLANRAAIAIENSTLLDALRVGDQRKDEFLAMLAHELRNPLAPIRNALHIIRVKSPPQPQLQWARDVIERQVLQLNRLVDDLLDISRITKGKIELRRESVHLDAVVNSALEASRPLIEKSGHHLTVTLPEQPVCLDADLTRLAQVLSNLLNNAAKYTPRGGHISLSAILDGEEVIIRVRDDGIGISPETVPHIFEMFNQADSSLERSQGGLGIGLTLVQLLVNLHGGSVEAHSDGLGTGSEFLVRLPARADRALVADITMPGLTETLASFPTLSILVVDDNKDAAESLAMLLRLTGSEVHVAHDGLDAVDAAASFHPDVAILDIGLPGLNGYEVARRIRAEHGEDIFLIALTGWGQDEDRRRSREAGFDHHLTKPIELESLRAVLARAAR